MYLSDGYDGLYVVRLDLYEPIGIHEVQDDPDNTLFSAYPNPFTANTLTFSCFLGS